MGHSGARRITYIMFFLSQPAFRTEGTKHRENTGQLKRGNDLNDVGDKASEKAETMKTIHAAFNR